LSIDTNHSIVSNSRYYGRHNDSGKIRTIHAEMAACWKLPRHMLIGATVVVVRVYHDDFVNSEPCECCQRVLKKLGVKTVYYST